jgi:thiol-disulfide isomerase/thioredoxin
MKKIIYIAAISAITFGLYSFVYSPSNPEEEQRGGLNVGEMAPEIDEKSPEGKIIKLSSIKGKYVLIDFWASWCGPCRRENPNIVAAYEKYKDAKFEGAKGFTIYSVSLDKNSDAWVNAIKQDNLSWSYHVSDLKGWDSRPGGIYGVTSIPINYLIDPSGKIIAKNLRGADLHFALDKLLKQ